MLKISQPLRTQHIDRTQGGIVELRIFSGLCARSDFHMLEDTHTGPFGKTKRMSGVS